MLYIEIRKNLSSKKVYINKKRFGMYITFFKNRSIYFVLKESIAYSGIKKDCLNNNINNDKNLLL